MEHFDYLEHQQVGASTRGAFLHTCKWISERLTLPPMDWKNPVLKGFIKFYENEIAKETKKAPHMPASLFRRREDIMMRWYQGRTKHDALIIILEPSCS